MSIGRRLALPCVSSISFVSSTHELVVGSWRALSGSRVFEVREAVMM